MFRAGLQKTSLVNYPGKVAAAVFLPGCNLRCPYCYNAALALADPATGHLASPQDAEDGKDGSSNSYFTEEEIFRHLEKRSHVLDGVAISGGEPLHSPFLEPLILKAKSLGLSVKVDTNGTLPERLTRLIEDESLRPDMIALDVKTAPKKYQLLAPEDQALQARLKLALRDASKLSARRSSKDFGAAVESSIGILAKAAAEALLVVEYRTVLVPGIVDNADVMEIAALLPRDAAWRFAAFLPANCLDPAWSKTIPYTQEEMAEIVEAARERVPDAELRTYGFRAEFSY